MGRFKYFMGTVAGVGIGAGVMTYLLPQNRAGSGSTTSAGGPSTSQSPSGRLFGPSLALPMERPPTRSECFEKLCRASSPANPLDILVIGGGATGAGIAVDAATRGLQVGLVEMNDYASGTSCRSTKLIHGGVRYLEKAVWGVDYGQLKLVFEALKERSVMLHQAPHICNPLPTIVPCYYTHEIIMYWAGMKLYDLLAVFGNGMLEKSRLVLPGQMLDRFPYLKWRRVSDEFLLLAGIEYTDGQMDDSRMCLSNIFTAACFGAATVNYCKVTGIEPSSSSSSVEATKSGKDAVVNNLTTVTVRDSVSGKPTTIYTRCIANASGPFSDSVQRLADDEHSAVIAPSSGTHVTLPAKYAPRDHALIVPSSDGRVVFMIPWKGVCIAGTTDTPCEISEEPRATVPDVDFILKAVADYYGPVPKTDVLSTWCGIRPLAVKKGMGNKQGTHSIVREHLITLDFACRMVSISGGKWTTYRKMAEDTVDTAIKEFGLIESTTSGAKGSTSSQTSDLVMLGGQHFADVEKSYQPKNPEKVSDELKSHWLHTYGDQIAAVESAASQFPTGFNKLCPNLPMVEGEVVYTMENEHCETVADFLSRRTRASFLNVVQAKGAVERVAELMAGKKGWSRSETARQVAKAKAHLLSFVPTPVDPKPMDFMIPPA